MVQGTKQQQQPPLLVFQTNTLSEAKKVKAMAAVSYALAHCHQIANENRCEFAGKIWHIHGSELLAMIKLQYPEGNFTDPK